MLSMPGVPGVLAAQDILRPKRHKPQVSLPLAGGWEGWHKGRQVGLGVAWGGGGGRRRRRRECHNWQPARPMRHHYLHSEMESAPINATVRCSTRR